MLSIKQIEELTGAKHEPCDPKNLPFPIEEQWVQITVDDVLAEASKKPEKPKKPIFSDDLWDEVQDMREEYYITRRYE